MLNFPVLRYSDEDILSPIKSWRALNISRAGWFYADRIKGHVVDSDGARFKIVNVNEVGLAFAPYQNLFGEEKILKLELELEKIDNLDLNQFKKLLFEIFDRHPRWIPKDKRKFMDISYKNASTIKEVINLDVTSGYRMTASKTKSSSGKNRN